MKIGVARGKAKREIKHQHNASYRAWRMAYTSKEMAQRGESMRQKKKPQGANIST